MPTYVTKAELADAKQKLDQRITELVTRLNGIDQRLSALEAAPAPEPEPEPAPAVFDWYYAINTTLIDPIAKPNGIVVVQRWNTDRIAAAKAIGAKVLIYQNCTRAGDPDAYGNYNSGLTRAEAGSAVTGSYDSDAYGYIVKPGTAGYAEKWAAAVIARCRALGADGVFLDDMNAQTVGVQGGVGSSSTWNAEMEKFNSIAGPQIRAAGLLAIPNMSGTVGQIDIETNGWLERQFSYFDGGMDEFFYTWPGGTVMPATLFERALDICARQTAAGKLYLAHTNGPVSIARIALTALQENNKGRAGFYTETKGYGSQVRAI